MEDIIIGMHFVSSRLAQSSLQHTRFSLARTLRKYTIYLVQCYSYPNIYIMTSQVQLRYHLLNSCICSNNRHITALRKCLKVTLVSDLIKTANLIDLHVTIVYSSFTQTYIEKYKSK
jgi:hypothetical protein